MRLVGTRKKFPPGKRGFLASGEISVGRAAGRIITQILAGLAQAYSSCGLTVFIVLLCTPLLQKVVFAHGRATIPPHS